MQNITSFIKKNAFSIILVLGILARFIWILIMPTVPETDFMWYHRKGIELALGKGFLNGVYPTYVGQPDFPTAFRPIGYPGTLAALYYFFGSDLLVGKIFNIFLSGLIMVLTYKLAEKFVSKKVALLAMAFYAFFPLSITYTSMHCSEILFCAVLMLTTYFFFNKNNPIVIGLLIGYLTLIRPIGMYIPLIFVLYIFLNNGRKIKETLKYIAIFIVAFSVVVAPWLIRNVKEFGEPVFSTNGGYVFYVNNNDYATGSWSDPFKYPNSPMLKYKFSDHFDEIGIDKEGTKLAKEWILKNPDKFLRVATLRMLNSYWLKTDDIMWSMVTAVNTWHPATPKAKLVENIFYKPFYIFMFLFIIYAVVRFIRLRKMDFMTYILFIFAYFNAMMFVLEGNSRYVFPLHPLYMIGVAFLIFKGIESIKNKKLIID